ncbi:hypothetical protein ACWF99_00235 [Nocardia sp. NPDC055002]
MAQFLTSVGAAWYAIALDEIMGWEQERVAIAYDEVIIETARQTPTP